MRTRARGGAVLSALAGAVLVVAGTWMTLASLLGWALARVLPQSAAQTLMGALVTVMGEVVARAWPLSLVALGSLLVAHGLLARRWAPARGRMGR